MHRRTAGLIVALLAGALLLTGCLDSEPSAQDNVRDNRQTGYEKLVENPLHPIAEMSMDEYSPTLKTVGDWVTRWAEPGKLGYMYMLNADSVPFGYYIIEGLPVSYCTSGTPTYDFEHRDLGQYDGDVLVPAPAMDGAYYSGSECNRYYATEAVTGQGLDWTVGLGTQMMVFEFPVESQFDIEPLFGGQTTIEDVQQD